MKETDIAWAAGFFDGEGAVMLSPKGTNGSYYTLYATVGQVNPRPLLKLQQLFGGVVKKRKATTSAGNPFSVWRTAADTASNALTLMLPHLVDKQEEVKLALHMQDLKQKGKRKGTIRYSIEEHDEFNEIYRQFKEVKASRRRGELITSE